MFVTVTYIVDWLSRQDDRTTERRWRERECDEERYDNGQVWILCVNVLDHDRVSSS